jgi:hypothetical protein
MKFNCVVVELSYKKPDAFWWGGQLTVLTSLLSEHVTALGLQIGKKAETVG